MNFEQLPFAVEEMQSQLMQMNKKLDNISQGIILSNEKPIDSKELRERLDISEPTEIRYRKSGKIPYLQMEGTIRYLWCDVVKALQKYKKS